MKVRMLWAEPEDEGWNSWLLGSVCESTIDAHNGLPDDYAALKREHPTAREVIVDIGDVTELLFTLPRVVTTPKVVEEEDDE